MNQTVVKIENLVKRYKDVLALDHFNLEIEEGEVFGLLGPNGSGKTTTINCLLSLLTYDKGTIEVFGKPMRPDSYSLKRNIGVVMQNVAVFEELTVYENIDYFCGLYVKNKTERRKLVGEAIEFVGLEDYTKFLPKKLSGGLLRRLNIACGIAHQPKLIIMDEPFVGLDPKAVFDMKEIMREMCKEGKTIFFSTHILEVAEKLCSRVAIIKQGKIVKVGNMEEVKGDESLEKVFLELDEENLEKGK